MSFQSVHQSRSQNSQSSTSSLASRSSLHQSKRPPTQEDIEKEAFNQNKFEAFGLQLKEKNGTITPVEQERLGSLQAKMNDFWGQYEDRAKVQPNLLEILVSKPQTSQIHAIPVQPKLTIGQLNDPYEQEAEQVAERVLSMAPPVTPNIQRQTEKSIQSKCKSCQKEEEEIQRSPSISSVAQLGIQRWSLFGDDEDKTQPEDNSSGGVLDWAKEQVGGAVDTVTQAGSDAYDWAKDKAGAAVDTVTQAGSDAYDWAKDKAGAAVDTVTQAGSDAYDWTKEKGEQFSNELFENKKSEVLAQISEAMQKVAGQDFVYLTDSQIATLNGHLATLSTKSQGSINVPSIAAQTDITDANVPTGTKPVAASTVTALLQNLQSSLSLPFMSPSASDTSDSDNSGTVQEKIQRVAIALVPIAIGAAVIDALIIMGIIVIIILLASKVNDKIKEIKEEKEREKEEEKKEPRPPKDMCNKAIKVLEQYERLAEKLGKKIPPKRLQELNEKRNAGTITSNDLPGFLEFPGGQLVGMTLAAIRKLCGK